MAQAEKQRRSKIKVGIFQGGTSEYDGRQHKIANIAAIQEFGDPQPTAYRSVHSFGKSINGHRAQRLPAAGATGIIEATTVWRSRTARTRRGS